MVLVPAESPRVYPEPDPTLVGGVALQATITRSAKVVTRFGVLGTPAPLFVFWATRVKEAAVANSYNENSTFTSLRLRLEVVALQTVWTDVAITLAFGM